MTQQSHPNTNPDSKVVLCGRRNTLATFWEDALHFPWQVDHFGHLRCHFAWQGQHFRLGAACFLRIALSALREVVTRCKFRRKPGILRHVMKIDGSLARNVDFEVGSWEKVDFEVAKCEI